MLEVILIFIAIVAGFIGAILGLGGGIILVPVLTLGFGIDIRYAIAASLISIVATSSGAAANFIQNKLTNIRLGVFLEVGTVTGAITGFLISSFLSAKLLYILFSVFLIFSGVMMFRKRTENVSNVSHPWADFLGLNGSSAGERAEASYKVVNVPLGLGIMYVAGVLSAVLGIGSGVFKVMAMDTVMKIPIKVSSATSNFMIGVTAAGSAGAYFVRGDVVPEIAAPVALGVLVGSFFGAKAMVRMSPQILRWIFIVLMFVVSVQMFFKGIR